MTQRRRYRYNKRTPFIELFKPEYQRWLIVGDIAKEFKSLLHFGESIDVRKLAYLNFRLTKYELDDKPCCTHTQIRQWVKKLLAVTGSEGTRYGKSMINRYILETNSNFYTRK